MKKVVAVLLTLLLLMGTGSLAFANGSQLSTATLPAHSEYEFEYQLPSNVVTDKEAALGVTFQTSKLGADGYEGVHFEIEADYDGSDGDVVFAGKDSDNHSLSFTNSGNWGTIDLPASYDKTFDWDLQFSKAGDYTITFTALDENNTEIAKIDEEIKVSDAGFIFTVPDKLLVDTEETLKVALVTEQDYENVHYEIAKTDGDGDILFKVQNSDESWLSFTNKGSWGTGFDIAGPYNVSTDWVLKFSEAGEYTVTYKLVDDNDDVLVKGSQELVVKDSTISDDEDNDEDSDENIDEDNSQGGGNTHGLLNALRNHLKAKKNGNTHARSVSTAKLMELLMSRGLTKADIEEAIEELEAALQNYQEATDDDYKALGKMHKLNNEEHETYIKGKKVEFDVPPMLEKGRTLVPFRKIAEELGAIVTWNPIDKTITVTKGDKEVVIQIDKGTALVDGKEVKLDVPAKVYKNRTLVPLRFLAESLNAKVDYYSEGAMIVIN